MIRINYPVLLYVRNISKQKPQRYNLRTLSLSKHPYVTTKVSVTVILNLLSLETGLTLSVSSAAGSSLNLQDSETS